MKSEIPIEELLRWRLAQAETDTPPAPRAARLLELSRPWWERWPEQFQATVERLGKIQIALGHAMAEPQPARSGHPIPALLVRPGEASETSVRLLYFDVRDGRLRLRFEGETTLGPNEKPLEVTFVCEKSQSPILAAQAFCSVEDEYRLDAEISEQLARSWERLRVTDRMPFRLILRTE